MTVGGALQRAWRPGLCALLCLSSAAAPAPTLPPNDLVARGRHAAVVTGEPHATAVGLQVLRDGGNAVDAAVAVALTLAVTHPQAGNLGGGGFFVIRMADGRTTSLDFRERAPRSAKADMYLKPDGSVDEDRIQFGASAAGVPGSPAGLLYALQKFGTRNLADVAGPAIRLAREGIGVDQFLAEDLAENQKELARFPSTKKVFFRGDKPLAQGDVLVQPDLAATIERFAEKGLEGFYGGRTAELLVAQMQADGGFVTAQDLSAYAVRERPVLRGTYHDIEVLSMPPPSSGGVALLQMLNLLESYDLRALGFGGSEYIHLLTEVMRRAYADRSRWLGDPDHYQVPVEGLVGKEYAAKLRAGIDLESKSEVKPGVPPGSKESDDTTHFSIVDRFGNAVACTTTINSTFGSAVVVDGAGFLLNNEMDDFSAKPGVPNQFGLVGGAANAIGPGKRMLSSMTPTIVLQKGELRCVLGAPGGGRIITAVLQVLLNMFDHHMGLEAAVRAPRVHHQWLPDEITWEEQSLTPDVRQALIRKGHSFAAKPRGIGQVFAIEVLPDGARLGVCDHRSGGSALAY
ncbi:MAG TPA: gamma-glutamyltransferase [Planctomycetota bacterium]|nr:gamma-glutamyltransferase [Planctomycetota bacterium]